MDYTLEMVPIIEQAIKKQLTAQQSMVVELELQLGAMIEAGASEDSPVVSSHRTTLLMAEASVEIMERRLADFEAAKTAAEGERMALIRSIVAGKQAERV